MLPRLSITARAVPPDAAALPPASVWRDGNGRACAYAYAAGDATTVHLPGIGWFRLGDDDADHVTAVRDTGAPEHAVARAYRHVVLPLFLSRRGREVLHASAVHDGRGVAAFCAASGTGKTTLLRALTARGHTAWADDALVIDAARDPATTTALPPYQAQAPQRPTAGTTATLRHLVVLQRADQGVAAPVLRPVPPARAFTALLAHAYCLDLDDSTRRRAMVEHYLDLCARVPVWELHYTSDLRRLPQVVDVLERELGLELTAAQ